MNILRKIILVFTILTAVLVTSNAQDGAKLFKQNCAACHKTNKNSTGPMLMGVKAKWAEAEESELLYEWVANPSELYESGKSKMAKAVWDYSKSAMTPMPHLKKEEVDAILTYADTPIVIEVKEEPKDKQAESSGIVVSQGAIVIICTIILFLFISVIILSNALKTLKRSQAGITEEEHPTKEILSFSKNGMYYGILFALLAYLYFYEVFNLETTTYFVLIISSLVIAYFVIKNSLKTLTEEGKNIDSVLISNNELTYDNNSGLGFLTQAVSIEDEEAILLDHNYDGIQELDNVLPPWWVWMFYGTIIFSFIYWGLYQTFNVWPLQEEAYQIEMAESEEKVYAYKKANNLLISAKNVIFLTEEADIAAGKKVFEGTCKVCHGAEGEGLVGPNLTDKHWIYGGEVGNIFTSIYEGRPNGMEAQKGKLNEKQIQQVVSYIHVLKYKEGKAPEGELME
jgi:cytochrome c oxidase cbb3-type subunit 3